MLAAFRALFAAVLGDRAAALLLFGAPVLYAFFYPSAYAGEIVVRAPVAIVDLDRSSQSRALIEGLRGAQQTELVAQLATVAEAERLLADGRAVAALVVPADFAMRIGQGRAGEVVLVGHGGYLLRASTALAGLGAALAEVGRRAARDQARAQGAPAPPPLTLVARPLFNTREGYGAAVFPGVAFVIIHQTLVMGLALLAATARERLGHPARLTPAQFAGVAAAAMVIALGQIAWFAGFVFWFQDYPRAGAAFADLVVAALLFAGATVGLALLLASLYRTRERPLQLWLATSLPLFFLTGLSWPREATPAPLMAFAQLFPTTPGLRLMIGLNQMGGRLSDYMADCLMLAILALGYGALAAARLQPPRRAAPIEGAG